MYVIDWNIVKDIIGMLVATGTTLFVFYKTLNKDKANKLKNHEELIKNRLTIFSNLIDSSKVQISNSILFLKENINEFEKDNLNNHLLKTSSNNSIKRLLNLINNEDYFLSYVEYFGNHKTKNFNNICILIEYFNNQINQIFEIKSKHLTFDENRKHEYSKLVEDIFSLIYKIEDSHNIITENEKVELDKICYNFNSKLQDKTNLESYENLFIQPLSNSKLIKNNHNLEIKKLKEKLTLSSEYLKRIKFLNSVHSNETLKPILLEMKKFYKKLEEETIDISQINKTIANTG